MPTKYRGRLNGLPLLGYRDPGYPCFIGLKITHVYVAPAVGSGIVFTSAERKELTTKTRKTRPMNNNTDTTSINSTKPNPNDGVVII